MHSVQSSHPQGRTKRHSARLTATAGALSSVTLLAVMAVGQPEAYADIRSGQYTIGTPSSGVTSLVASPDSLKQGEAASFQLKFKAGAALSGSHSSWVSVAPSEALGATPTKVQLIGGSCLQAGTSGAAGSGAATTSGVTIDLSSSCTIGSGDQVEVDFTASAPSTTGSFTFNVTTSNNETAAVSNTVVVRNVGPTLSALSYFFGDNTTYTVSDVPVASVSSNGNTITLKPVATAGSDVMALDGAAGGYGVSVTPSGGGTATTDAVQKAARSGSNAILTLATALTNGETLDLTANGTNPTSSSTSVSDALSVQPGNGTAEQTNAITFGHSVTGVTVSSSTPIPRAPATYTVAFKATSAVASGGSITLSEQAGPTNFSGASGVLITDVTQKWHYVATGTTLKSGNAQVPVPGNIKAGDLVTLTLLNVANPRAETIGDFAVTTSADVVPAYAAPYSIGVAVNPGVVVSVNPSSTGALAGYVISNLRASTALSAGTSTITVHGPKGTVFPGLAGDYAFQDSTRSSGTGTVKTIVSGGGTSNVQLDVPTNIAAGDTLSITIQDAINPGTSSSNYAIDIVGGVVGPTPTSSTTSTTTTTAPHPTTTTPQHRVQPRVSALTTSAKVHGHAFRLWLSCRKATCSGWLRVYDGRPQLAAYHYRNLRPGHQWGYVLKLNQKGFNMLNRSKHHSMRVEQVAFVYGGQPARRVLTLHR